MRAMLTWSPSVVLVALAAAVSVHAAETTAGGPCPAAPSGFVVYPLHCIGDAAPACAFELKTGGGCTVVDCVTTAVEACKSDIRCHGIAVESDCGDSTIDGITTTNTTDPATHRWHTFSKGPTSLVANPQWVAYTLGAAPPTPPTPPPSPSLADQLRCGLRHLAVETTAARLAADFGPRAASLVADAVRIQDCPSLPSNRLPRHRASLHPPGSQGNTPAAARHSDAGIAFYISPTGSDTTGAGTIASPFFSPHRARAAVRTARGPMAVGQLLAPATVHLGGGVYHLGMLGSLELTAADANTQWVATDPTGPQPVLSGAVALGTLDWSAHNQSILVASLPTSIPQFSTLFDESREDVRRLIRARYPNGDPEQLSGLCFLYGSRISGVEGCTGYLEPAATGNTQFSGQTLEQIAFNTTRGGQVRGDDVYKTYDVIFQAPPANLAAEGYPVAVCNSGEGGGELYNRSSSVQWKPDPVLDRAGSWARVTDAVVHMMHNGWGNVQYRVAAVNSTSRMLQFERGGFQHGRAGKAGVYYVENQLELLDAPGEWYFDTTSSKLYLWPNASAPPPLSAAMLESVIVINGTRLEPVTNISFFGIGFSRTVPTYLRPYERPISGDWAIHRGGTVLVTGAMNISFDRCNFTRTGGNALTFSRFVRDSTVTASEFFSTGDSAIVAYGDIDWKTGDARGGEYPSGLVMQRNLAHEIGVWGKQVSCFFQGVSGLNDFSENVCFNGPRAMVNINDGMMGRSNITGNVLFNGCRESDDHGNFNSWDRTPMLHVAADGSNSWSPDTSTVSRNLLLNSYGASHGIDHDDGSNFWNDVENVVGFSHACKGNYGSNRNCSRNIVIGPGMSDMFGQGQNGGPCAEETNNGHGSTFANKYFEYNTCVNPNGGSSTAYSFASCDPAGVGSPELNGTVWATRGNTFWAPPNATIAVPCKGGTIPLSTWQDKYGQDFGAVVEAMPPMADVMEAARQLLQF